MIYKILMEIKLAEYTFCFYHLQEQVLKVQRKPSSFGVFRKNKKNSTVIISNEDARRMVGVDL